MNNKQSLNQQDETILLAMELILFIALQFCQARELLEGLAVHFDTLKYLRIHFYCLFSQTIQAARLLIKIQKHCMCPASG